MKTNYLLPNKYKNLGWLLFIIGILGGLFIYVHGLETSLINTKVFAIFNINEFNGRKGYFEFIENAIEDELIAIFIIVGGLIVGFTKEKVEDEYIHKLRHDSLVWAIIVNYIILLFAIALVYNFTFFDVLVFNMFTPLIIFIIRFNFLKLKLNSNEE